jgi:hypothetical protein
MKLQTIAFLLFITIFISCGSPATIDGTSKEKYDQSLSNMLNGLDETQRNELTSSILVIASTNKNISISDDLVRASLYRAFDGMTKDDIINKANEIKAEADKKNKSIEDATNKLMDAVNKISK